MEQDEALLPYTINPDLQVHTPVPLATLDGEIDTTLLNLRLTTQLMRRLAVAVNYRYDERDNNTPRAVYPYIGGDSQDQRPFEDGRINLPYSYEDESLNATATWRLNGRTRLKGGVEWSDYSREYSEVADSDEFGWTVGVNLNALESLAFSLDYRESDRDVDAYVGNRPLIDSHVPGTIEEDEWENHPLLRKYFLTDRERDEVRLRADFFPITEFSLGLAFNQFEDDYGDGFFGLNEAEIDAYSVDFGWYPKDGVALTGYYTQEEYDSDQSNRSFNNAAAAEDPDRNWFANTNTDVDTWNLSLEFSNVGEDRGWRGVNFGFDWTVSDTSSRIDVTSPGLNTAPLPNLRSELHSLSAWALLTVGVRSSLRISVESEELETDDFGLDNVVPDTLANVLTLGQSAANYDLILVTASFTYHFE